MIDTDELERTREANGPGNFVYIICEEYLSARKRIEEIESENKRLKDTVTGLDAHADRCLAEKNLHVQMILDKQFNQGLLEAKLGIAVEALKKIEDKDWQSFYNPVTLNRHSYCDCPEGNIKGERYLSCQEGDMNHVRKICEEALEKVGKVEVK